MNKTLREIALSISYPPFLVGKMVLNYALSKEYLHIHQTAQKDHHNVKDVIKKICIRSFAYRAQEIKRTN